VGLIDFCSLFQNSFLIIGTGSPLRQDDQAGLIACDELLRNDVFCLKCEYGVENCFGEIERFKPRYLIIIDAALFENGRPGDIIITSEESISEVNLVLSTHNIPLTLLIDLMKKTWRLEKIYVIGIYPKSMDLGLEVSLEVFSSIERLVEEIKKCIRRERRMEELV